MTWRHASEFKLFPENYHDLYNAPDLHTGNQIALYRLAACFSILWSLQSVFSHNKSSVGTSSIAKASYTYPGQHLNSLQPVADRDRVIDSI